ncbi:hypothetical protein OHT52_15115 [Streptomyces sp. NBC_00247]|uniref:hypothetical protein n=1 Tax=Streptomyces sp. NBC_00247 TaxID=2975689 RepID=UPI002E29AFD8|nr:hypothetical protein [Streptomyces sp. NBC_00247]
MPTRLLISITGSVAALAAVLLSTAAAEQPAPRDVRAASVADQPVPYSWGWD